MKRFLVIAAVALAGCTGGGNNVNPGGPSVGYFHDDARGVSCWLYYGNSISCLPDSQITGAD